MSKELRIQNRFVEGLVKWLWSLQLDPFDNQARVLFANIITPQINKIEKQRVDTIVQFAQKDKEGNPVTILMADGKRNYNVPDEKMGELNQVYNKILDEYFVIPITDENKELINRIKGFVFDSNQKFGVVEGESENHKALKMSLAIAHSEWVRIFQELKLD